MKYRGRKEQGNQEGDISNTKGRLVMTIILTLRRYNIWTTKDKYWVLDLVPSY